MTNQSNENFVMNKQAPDGIERKGILNPATVTQRPPAPAGQGNTPSSNNSNTNTNTNTNTNSNKK